MPTPTDITIVIPTVDSRRQWLAKATEAYQRTAPGCEIIVKEEYGSCGDGWIAGWKEAKGKYIHFTADDIIPHDDWWQEAIEFLDRGTVPVCRVINGYGHAEGQEVWVDVPCGKFGDPRNVMVPFLTREMLEEDELFLLPIHYGSDAWVSYRAVTTGHPVEVCPSYMVTHYLAPCGRVPHRQVRDIPYMIQAMEDSGYLPPFWQATKRKYGMVDARVQHID